ncbi:MAG: hypothetical protein F2670_03085 [Actinobacteria bacterium]|uniref:Unannotated protein n=1 Tax=freshwater metagenome TaxID=449393 RepID=A0A6J7M5A7_9ZZZZ|nr:hypothetical protein [Actinomycetota bacterium]MSY15893.1 hypothetical protein [Actinomycetota bacterium]MTA79527.1 hypothetical protein [Actinomycetota bacterium]
MIAMLDIIATFAFALVGARIAADRRMDYGGILLIATVASLTGGSLRNLFLGERPIWLQQPWYFLSILLAVAITIALRITRPVGKVVLAMDTLGLAVAVVSGVQYSLDHYAPSFAAVILGVLTAVAGGLLRDVLCQVEPVLLHRETIGTACTVGALVYVLIEPTSLPNGAVALISGAVIVLVRSVSIKKGWNLPKVK